MNYPSIQRALGLSFWNQCWKVGKLTLGGVEWAEEGNAFSFFIYKNVGPDDLFSLFLLRRNHETTMFGRHLLVESLKLRGAAGALVMMIKDRISPTTEGVHSNLDWKATELIFHFFLKPIIFVYFVYFSFSCNTWLSSYCEHFTKCKLSECLSCTWPLLTCSW